MPRRRISAVWRQVDNITNRSPLLRQLQHHSCVWLLLTFSISSAHPAAALLNCPCIHTMPGCDSAPEGAALPAPAGHHPQRHQAREHLLRERWHPAPGRLRTGHQLKNGATHQQGGHTRLHGARGRCRRWLVGDCRSAAMAPMTLGRVACSIAGLQDGPACRAHHAYTRALQQDSCLALHAHLHAVLRGVLRVYLLVLVSCRCWRSRLQTSLLCARSGPPSCPATTARLTSGLLVCSSTRP